MSEYLEFDAGTTTFALHVIPAAARCDASAAPQPREKVPVKLSFEVDDVASERNRLEALGVTIIERPWGACDGVDPEGNIFGIYSASGH
jgi:predicted enzyme related to lactoylglutathione lyase